VARKRIANRTLYLEGEEELRRALNRLEKSVRGQAIVEALMAGARPIVQRARSYAPKQTGRLMRSIGTEVGRVGDTYAIVRVGPGDETLVHATADRRSRRRASQDWISYGLFTEWGAAGRKKIGWLKKATLQGKTQFLSIVRLRLRRILLARTR